MKILQKTFLLLAVVCLTNTIKAQKIKFEDGSVTVDGVVCLNYNKVNASLFKFTTLDSSQTIILKFIRTGVGSNGGLYTKIIFMEHDKSLTSRSYIFTKKNLVKNLIKHGALQNCNINEESIDTFISSYDEMIEETLIRE